MSHFVVRSFSLLVVLVPFTGRAAAIETYNRFTTVTSAVENRCFATTASTNGDDCSANASNPTGLGKSQWIGPMFGAAYYPPGAGPQIYTNPLVPDPVTAPQAVLPLAGMTGITVKGMIGMSDSGTPADPTDDLIGGSLEFGAYDRNFDAGDGTRGLEHDQASLHGIDIRRATSATKNAAGGFDYIVGQGIPVLKAATGPSRGNSGSFPSAVASQSSPSALDKAFWSAPARVGVSTFEGNVGTFTRAETVPTGYSCTTDRGNGPIACPVTPAIGGGPARVFENVLMKLSTDRNGRITAGQIVLVQERKAWPDAARVDSWQALTIGFTGTIDSRPAAVDDTVALRGSEPVKIKVLANDTGLADKPLTVLMAIKPANGTATVNPDNTITYTPNPGTTRDEFRYRVTDRDGDTTLGTVRVGK